VWIIAYINFTTFLLKPDGANFTDWYMRLRTSLQQYDALYTIIEPLGPPPGGDLDQARDDAFRDG
jgi:hypothetical protein